jgi:membrane-associated protease RseP (regulator of RpoE activity)
VNIISGDNGRGITVMRTQPNTAADRMGLQPRDRIVSLNGQPVDSVDDFIGAIGTMNPGDQVELTVERNGNERTIRGTLEAYAESMTRFEGPVAQGINRIRGIIGRERGPDVADDRGNIQTSYEDQGGSSSRSSSGDADARIGRLEQQIDRLNREIQELREARNSSQPGSAAPSGSSSERSGSSAPGSSSQPGSSNSSSSSSGAAGNSTGPDTSGGNIPAPSSSQSR